MSEPVPTSMDEISAVDWAQMPERVVELVRGLVEQNAALSRQNEALQQQNEALRTEVETLREQVQRNSKNSSQPPSQDRAKGFQPKAKEKRSGKARGAQFGHAGQEQRLYPVEACSRVEDHYPERCIDCGAALSGSDPAPYRIQQVELPVVKPIVQEHRFHSLRCGCCGSETRAWDESMLNSSRYGERVAAHVGVLSGLYRLSHGLVQRLFQDLFDIEISTGSIAQLRQENSQAVAQAVEAARGYVQQQAQVNMDETSFAQGNYDGQNANGRQGWLWVVVTPLVSYFAVHLSRAGAVVQALLGEDFQGIVGSDRYSAYNGLALSQRQLCWAHLKRDFTQIAERTGVSQSLGERLLAQQRALFEQWYRVRDGTLSRAEFATLVHPIRAAIHQLLTEGATYPIGEREQTPLSKTVRTCEKLLQVEPALWTFVTTVGIEPTNNAAERALRPAVLWRKTSFGSQSAAGSLFVARLLTVVTSLRSQNRSVLAFLEQSCRAARHGHAAPSLLPVQDSTP